VRIFSAADDTASTTPCAFNTSIATVSPIRNQPSKKHQQPATTSTRNRCTANREERRRNEAPMIVWKAMRARNGDEGAGDRDCEGEVADGRLDQVDRGLSLAQASSSSLCRARHPPVAAAARSG
jgi:hypothetical protein